MKMAFPVDIYVIFHLLMASLVIITPVYGQRSSRNRELSAHFDILEESPSQSFVGNIITGAGLNYIYNSTVLKMLEFGFINQPGHDTDYFSIESDTGILRTSQPIDRDTKCPGKTECDIDMVVAIQKPVELFQPIAVKVTLIDINDQSPTFHPHEYEIKFSESDPVGTYRSLPIALDLDSPQFGVSSYRMLSQVPEFDLHQNMIPGSGFTELKLVLVYALDREVVNTYMVRIEAKDGGTPPRNGTLLIDIAVEDDNDHSPQFENNSYIISLNEDFTVNTTFFTIHAKDPDAGDNGRVVYSFAPLSASLYGSIFRLHPDTGQMSLKKPLDYESVTNYHLEVVASDMAPSSRTTIAQVAINVIDVNDNRPEISISTLTDKDYAEIEENLPATKFVAFVSVADSDVGENGDVLCSLGEDPLAHTSFNLIEISGKQYKIVTAISLDREAVAQYFLKVECYDMGSPSLSSSRDLAVIVLDQNDHSPVFHPSIYTESIRENNMMGDYILRVNATDSDTGLNCDMRFNILENSVSKYVYIEEVSGVIRASSHLNFEEIQMFQFTVSVQDLGTPHRSATASVTINILDTNDEPPRFEYPHYSFSVLENEHMNTLVGQVSASDRDSPPFNIFEFSMSAHHEDNEAFMIDSITGEIKTMRKLDREERDVYYLTVFASDIDNPTLIGSASVTIYVGDVNDNFPVITFPLESNRTFEISSKAPVGYNITRVIAKDKDIGDNGHLSFIIVSGDEDGMFVIDAITGLISVQIDLSQVVYEERRLEVIVQDAGDSINADRIDLLMIVDKTLPYIPPEGPGDSIVRRSNLTIIIVVAAISGFIIVVLIIAIALLKTLDRRRFQGKEYNCRTEEQKILTDLNIKAVEANGNLHAREILGHQARSYETPPPPGQTRLNGSLKRKKERGAPSPRNHLELEECGMTNDLSKDPTPPAPSPLDLAVQQDRHLEAHLMALLKQDQDGDSASSADMSNTDSGRGGSEEGEAFSRYGCGHIPPEYSTFQGTNSGLSGHQGYIHPRVIRPTPRAQIQPRVTPSHHLYAHGHTLPSNSPGRPGQYTSTFHPRKSSSEVDVQRPGSGRKNLGNDEETSSSLQSLPTYTRSPGGQKRVTFTGDGSTPQRGYPSNQASGHSNQTKPTHSFIKDNKGQNSGCRGDPKGSQDNQREDVWQYRQRRPEPPLRDIKEESDNSRSDDNVNSEELCQTIDEIFFKQKSVVV